MRVRGRVGIFILAMAVVLTVAVVGSIGASGEIKGSDEKAAGGTENAKTPEGLDVIVISNDVYEKDRRGPVTFSHRKHAKEYKILCWECHHEYEDDVNTWSPWDGAEKCSECHDPDEKMDEVMRLQTAFHVNCKNCHKAMAEENKKTGPYRKCLTCHEKKK